ncbi:molybdate ABC transporter substrate-binding protein [Lutibacter sp.]|uniref:molybdate ABC transporter substrate-binding protein n=1 Tax=Lutibacter sp. TaxID=1925666 RepID=UPI0035618549
MKKLLLFIPRAFIMLIFISAVISCSTNTKKLTIATAANMQYTVNELISVFHSETGIECQTVVSSSGKLTAQIMEGAPFDIFISADTKYPNELYKKGFAQSEPKIYAYGKLILWTLKDDIQPSIELLTNHKIKHIASANPVTAPYGKATEEVLNFYKILDSVKSKLVFGESIAQTNQFITSKVAEVGFTAKSVVLSPNLKEKGTFIEIDETSYNPIAQSAIIIKNNSKSNSKSEKFFNFLFSKKGKEILLKHGYTIPAHE